MIAAAQRNYDRERFESASNAQAAAHEQPAGKAKKKRKRKK